MRIVLFLNNWGGWKVAQWLRQSTENIVGAVLPPPAECRFGPEILSALDLPADRLWTSDKLRNSDTAARLRDLHPDIGISAFFPSILKPSVIDLFARGCINLHSAYLPFNRGWHTNVWPIIEGTPAGVTIHYIDPGVDTGDIIVQRQIPVEPTDTGGSLHEKITRSVVHLFKQTWPAIRAGTNGRTPQDHSKATIHRKAELAEISRIDLDRHWPARDLINLLRARTYPPYPAAYFNEMDRRTYVRIQLLGESKPPAATFGQRSARRIDLARQYRAKELLDLLLAGSHPASPPAYFDHVTGPVFTRACLLDERELNTKAYPQWMTEDSARALGGD